jgi:hypothetical protein
MESPHAMVAWATTMASHVLHAQSPLLGAHDLNYLQYLTLGCPLMVSSFVIGYNLSLNYQNLPILMQ